jgi:signal transduction histidine kinase
VRQVILNLLSNAAKFTRQGNIRLSIQRENHVNGDTEDWYRIKVVDTGIGIDPTKIGNLFDPFTQADSSSTRQFEGTGLGLTITRHLPHVGWRDCGDR